MSSARRSFGSRVVGNTLYSLLDLIFTKISTTIVFIILVRLIPDSGIAAIGIAMGYLVFISYLDVAPIRVLLRDYPQVAKDRRKRDEVLTALFLFWLLQAGAMLLVCLAINYLILGRLGIDALELLFFAMTVDFLALSLQGWIKIVYYTDFRQRIATLISLFFTIGRLVSYAILFISPSLMTYSWLLIITAVVACLTWFAAFVAHFSYRPIIDRNTPRIIMNSLSDYGLWDHFNRTIIDTLFVVDTVILSAIGQMRDIGSYTIALKFTSLLTLIPAQLASALQVVMANYTDQEKHHEAVNTFVKFNTLISIAQLLAIFLFGDWFIHLLFGQGVSPDVLKYSLIVGSGVTIFNIGFPFIGIINTHCTIKQAFFYVFFPSLLCGLTIYAITALQWGAIGVAYGNIVIYSILACGVIMFAIKSYPVDFRFNLLTDNEKALLRELIHMMRIKR